MHQLAAWLIAILINLVVGVAAARAHDPCECWTPPPPCDPCKAPHHRRAEFHATVLFATGSHALDAEAKATLDTAAKALKMFGDEVVLVHGHTDSAGSEDSNQILSLRRAISAGDYLRKQGVLASRISLEGFGETRPVADNRTAAGRSRNRRVEVRIGSEVLHNQ